MSRLPGSGASTAPRPAYLSRLIGRRPAGSSQGEERAAFLFLVPWLAGLIFFLAVPLGYAVWISMTDEQLLRSGRFIGLDNYVEIFTRDPSFLHSLRITLQWVVLTTPLFMAAGLGLSLLLNQKLPGMNVFRTILYIPAVLSGVAVAILWVVLLNGDAGAVNQLLASLGWTNPPNWFEDADWAMAAVAIMGMWGVGGGAVIFLAGLQNIPPHLYEAASIDGAGPLAKFRHITLPMLSPTLFFLFINALIDSLVIIGPLIVIVGRSGSGGPEDSLLFYMLYLYRVGFVEGQLGYGAALAWILTVIGCILVYLTFKAEKRFVYYETE
ncbi:MAG: sugar ABC transporter permease [Chloroflexi bacterium]|nr:sugar ABC transporter permease [Chloroflexota bacterium]